MAIVIQVEPPKGLDAGEKLTGVDIEVADNPAFSPLISLSNHLPKPLTYTLDIEFVNGKTYYVRARYITDLSGAERWSNAYSFVADNSIENIVKVKEPIKAFPPTLSIPLFEIEQTPHRKFKIDLSLVAENVGSIVSTSWIIEDTYGKVYLASVDNSESVTELLVETMLEPDTVYVAKASVESDTGSVSEYGALVFKTAGALGDFYIIQESIKVDTKIKSFKTNIPVNYKESEVEVYDVDKKTGGSTFNAPDYDVSGLTTTATTIIRVRAVYTDGTKSEWRYIYSDESEVCALPLPLPAQLGCI